MNYLEELNFEQKEAVIHKNGPLLILAGAGAGKTKTLTYRILNLIKEGVDPKSILAITFTNKAAKEMRDRVVKLLQSDPQLNMPVTFENRPFMSTFHSLGVYIIRENARLIGLTKNFTIFDKNDSVSAIKEAVLAENLDPKRFEPSKLSRAISKQKGDMVTIEDLEAKGRKDFFSTILLSIWRRYETILRREQALDFDDLLLKTALILKNHQTVLEQYQKQWLYIHIDEYQDTNKVQYLISKLLAEKSRNICVVGDIDQTIYSWRGADIRNILDFEKDYPEARTIVLEQNYRSTQTILDAANTVIKKNKRRKDKKLFTKNGPGEKIGLYEGYDETDEAHFIAEKSAELINNGQSAEEIAVLYRANFQSRILEEAFLSHKVPYQLIGTRFFERKEIKDTLSYLRAAVNRQSLSDIKRVINTPVRGIGKVTILKVLADKQNELTGTVREKVDSFFKILDNIAIKVQNQKVSEVLKYIIEASGMASVYRQGTEDEMERYENLQELVTLAAKYDHMEQGTGVLKLIEDATLQSDQDELEDEKKGVKLMTVHASKGLEFKYVFIAGLEENLFPHKSFNEDEVSDERAEEERRLFYVALTRARQKLFLTFASVRTIFGSRQANVPSEFLSDLDDSLVEFISPDNGGGLRTESENDDGKGNQTKREKVIYFD